MSDQSIVINELISELLYAHDCVVIPNFGGFLLQYVPASIHPVQHIFTPPSRTVAFNAALKVNDGILAKYVASAFNITYHDALEKLRIFSAECQLHLRLHRSLTFSGIGTLKLDNHDLIDFHPIEGGNYLADAFGLPVFTSPAILRSNEQRVSRPAPQDRKIPSKRRSIPNAVRWVFIVLPVLAVTSWLLYQSFKGPEFILDQATMVPGMESLAMVPKPQKPIIKQTPSNQNEAKADQDRSNNAETSTASTAKVVEPPKDEIKVETKPKVNDTKTDKQETRPTKQSADLSTAHYNEKKSVAKNEVKTVSVPKSKPVKVSDALVKEPSKTSEKSQNTVAQASKGFHVIAGCFASEENAKKFVADAKSKGFGALVLDKSKNGLFRVSAGVSSSQKEAEKLLERVNSGLTKGGWIVKK